MTIREILTDWLKTHGYDGLYRDNDCACKLAALMPCGEMDAECRPGYEQPCPGPDVCPLDGCTFHIGEAKNKAQVNVQEFPTNEIRHRTRKHYGGNREEQPIVATNLLDALDEIDRLAVENQELKEAHKTLHKIYIERGRDLEFFKNANKCLVEDVSVKLEKIARKIDQALKGE